MKTPDKIVSHNIPNDNDQVYGLAEGKRNAIQI